VVVKRVGSIRDAIEHLDEQLLDGRIREKEPVALVLKAAHLELGRQQVGYIELAEWLTGLYRLASVVAGVPQH
jgi:hypothetical protein